MNTGEHEIKSNKFAFIREYLWLNSSSYSIRLFNQSFLCVAAIALIISMTTAQQNGTAKTNAAKTNAAKNNAQANSMIITGFNVNVRETASIDAKTLSNLDFGTIVRQVERAKELQTVAGKTDFWYKVSRNQNQTGWVFGSFLKPFAAAKREAIYRQITADKFKFAKRSFTENAELYDFLTKAQGEVKTPETAAEIGLRRYQALAGALDAIPSDKQDSPPYKKFTTVNALNIVYSDPSAQFYVRADRLWSLAKKYETLPAGEKIAWDAARTTLPGECEGYLNCYLYELRQSEGEYLKRFPKGAHAAEALKSIGDQLQPIADDAATKEVYAAPADVTDRADFNKTIAELRTIVSRTGFIEKETVLKQLNKIGEGYR